MNAQSFFLKENSTRVVLPRVAAVMTFCGISMMGKSAFFGFPYAFAVRIAFLSVWSHITRFSLSSDVTKLVFTIAPFAYSTYSAHTT